VYTLAYRDQQNQQHLATLTFQSGATRAYFGGRLLGDEDRVGSRAGKYYPYGEDRSNPPPANDQVKFGTYTRDSVTGLDYADQRYYNSTAGRFVSPDPYSASSGTNDPSSWNRYLYTRGDPASRIDPSGLEDCGSDDPLAPLCTASDPVTGSPVPPSADPTIAGGPDPENFGCFQDPWSSSCSAVFGTAFQAQAAPWLITYCAANPEICGGAILIAGVWILTQSGNITIILSDIFNPTPKLETQPRKEPKPYEDDPCYKQYLLDTAFCGATYTDDEAYDKCMLEAWFRYQFCMKFMEERPGYQPKPMGPKKPKRP